MSMYLHAIRLRLQLAGSCCSRSIRMGQAQQNRRERGPGLRKSAKRSCKQGRTGAHTCDMAARSPAELYHAVSRRRARRVSALLALRPRCSQHSFTVACTLVLVWRRDVPAAARVVFAAPALSRNRDSWQCWIVAELEQALCGSLEAATA